MYIDENLQRMLDKQVKEDKKTGLYYQVYNRHCNDYESLIEKMKKRKILIKLAELIKNNPELEVICVCDEDCGGDISAVGEIAYCRIDAYVHASNRYGEDRCYFKYDTNDPKSTSDLTEDDMEVLRGVFYNEDIDDMPDDALVKKFQEIKWNPCIYVWIGVKQKEHE